MEKINFVNNSEPYLSAETLIQMQSNIETAIDEVNTYSTEETKIGTWKDGKPLYRKVVIVNDYYTTSLEIEHGIENYEKIWIDVGNSYYLANNGVTVPLIANSYWGDFAQKTDAMIYQHRIILYSTGIWGTDWKKVITLNYTKTTD